jgi:hypothetical protein
VIRTPQPALIGNTPSQVHRTVETSVTYETERARFVLEENQVFPKDSYLANRVL